MIKVSTTGMAVSLKTDLRFPISGQWGHGDRIIQGYSVKSVEVGKIHHDAETTQVWVVDKPAYTEYVYGEKCSGCDATK